MNKLYCFRGRINHGGTMLKDDCMIPKMSYRKCFASHHAAGKLIHSMIQGDFQHNFLVLQTNQGDLLLSLKTTVAPVEQGA